MIKASYSFFNDLENCPKKAQHKYVLRDLPREDKTPEQIWGNVVHEAFANRINDGVVLPVELQRYEPVLAVFDDKPAFAELKVGVTAEGRTTQFYADDAMVSGTADNVVMIPTLVDLTDWKTGKDKYETPFELELHALLIAARFDYQPAQYIGRYVYVGLDKVSETYDLSDVGATWAKVLRFMEQANAYNGEWPATPNPLCGWCPVKMCKHWKPKPHGR